VSQGGEREGDPRPAAVTFATTEHFVLQGARAATIAESTGRATMFLASVSGGLIALGLVATASRVGTAFYAFALVLLPTLAFVGFVTFERTLQLAIEDHGLERRIALLRRFYLESAPELSSYLVTVTPSQQLFAQGLMSSGRQAFRTVAGMVAVITAVLTGSTAAVIAIIASDHSLAASAVSGAVVASVVLAGLMRFQWSAFTRVAELPLITEGSERRA
jgi:hypothetical protein